MPAQLEEVASGTRWLIRRHLTNTIGRTGDCAVVISDGTIARRHASLTWTGAGWQLIDLGSSNGTFLHVGGSWRRLSKPDLLRSGDLLRMASKEFGFVDEGLPDLDEGSVPAREGYVLEVLARGGDAVGAVSTVDELDRFGADLMTIAAAAVRTIGAATVSARLCAVHVLAVVCRSPRADLATRAAAMDGLTALLLRDPDVAVRRESAVELGTGIGAPKEPLVDALADADDGVAREALASLRRRGAVVDQELEGILRTASGRRSSWLRDELALERSRRRAGVVPRPKPET